MLGNVIVAAIIPTMPNIFISYSHDTASHRDRVRELAERLRRDGVVVIIDRDKLPGGPDQGWPTWSEAQVKECDQVLVACTERYCRSYEGDMPPGQGLGAACEAGAIRQILYNQANINPKFRVILFEEGDGAHIPLGLQRYHRFELWREESYAELLAWVKPNPLGGAGVQPLIKPAAVQWPELINRPVRALANRDEEFDCFERMIQGRMDRREQSRQDRAARRTAGPRQHAWRRLLAHRPQGLPSSRPGAGNDSPRRAGSVANARQRPQWKPPACVTR